MSVEVIMPQMGESITEGTVSKWLKAVGDKIEKDEAILEISTDNVDAEVPSPSAGTLLPSEARGADQKLALREQGPRADLLELLQARDAGPGTSRMG